jgi:hypothetical protein
MATQTRAPTSDEAASGTLSGSAGTRYTLLDDHPDTTGADILTFGTTTAQITFGFSAFSVPAGSTINSVQVQYYDGEAANGANNCCGRLKVGASYFNAATHNPAGTTYTSRTDTWATNPATAAAWTVDQVNGIGANALAAFGIGSTDSNPTFRVSSVQLVVDYTLGDTTLTPGAISSGAVVGSPTLTATLTPSAITSSTIPTPALAVELTPAAISSGASVPTPSLATVTELTPNAISSTTSVGTPALLVELTSTVSASSSVPTPGLLLELLASVGATSSVATPRVDPTLTASSIASGSTVNTPTVAVGANDITVDAVVFTSSVATPTLDLIIFAGVVNESVVYSPTIGRLQREVFRRGRGAPYRGMYSRAFRRR